MCQFGMGHGACGPQAGHCGAAAGQKVDISGSTLIECSTCPQVVLIASAVVVVLDREYRPKRISRELEAVFRGGG